MSGRGGIRELAPDDMPRERLFTRGAASLSHADLVAIILNTGIKGEPVHVMAQRLLDDNGGLMGLMRMEANEIARLHGLGEAKAAKLKAALEIGSRLQALSLGERPRIGVPEDVVKLVGLDMTTLPHEELRAVLLDNRHFVLSIRTIYRGTVNQAQARVAEVFREAVRLGAVAIVVVHNHPSGDPTPSSADVALTADLAKAGELLDVDVLDHLIIAGGRHVSLRRLGLGFPTAGEARR
jgi:DNA repair protein RadC